MMMIRRLFRIMVHPMSLMALATYVSGAPYSKASGLMLVGGTLAVTDFGLTPVRVQPQSLCLMIAQYAICYGYDFRMILIASSGLVAAYICPDMGFNV